MARRRIRFAICYIKTRISFKEHIKRGAHLLAPGPAGVEDGFVREFMLLLDWISLGDKAQERGKEGSPCKLCDKASKVLPTPNQQKIWKHSVHVFVCKGCGKKLKTINSIKRHKMLV